MLIQFQEKNVMEKSESERVAPAFPGRHGPALTKKCDIPYPRIINDE
jgi:hypothetical protein